MDSAALRSWRTARRASLETEVELVFPFCRAPLGAFITHNVACQHPAHRGRQSSLLFVQRDGGCCWSARGRWPRLRRGSQGACYVCRENRTVGAALRLRPRPDSVEVFLRDVFATEPLQIKKRLECETAVDNFTTLARGMRLPCAELTDPGRHFWARFMSACIMYAALRWPTWQDLDACKVLRRYGQRSSKEVEEFEKLPILQRARRGCGRWR